MTICYPKKPACIPSPKKEAGMTLIELMIAMLLGLLLTAVVGTVFLSSKTSFTTATQLSRAQESSRFSASFLKRDIRNAGYTGCGSNIVVKSLLKAPILTQSGFYGWDATGTDVNNSGTPYDLSYEIIYDGNPSDLATTRSNNTSTGNWLDQAGNNLPSTLLSALQPMNGSDILALSKSVKIDLSIAETLNNLTTNSIKTTATTKDIIAQGQILKVGNCQFQDEFQNIASQGLTVSTGSGGNNFSPGNEPGAGSTWSQLWGNNDSLYGERTHVYYIGTGTGGIPSLFRYDSDCSIGTSCTGGSINEIVEGVENMQILYGEDTDPTPDFVANVYRSANSVGDFANVVSIRLGLLIRSPAAATKLLDTNNYELVDSVTINPPNERFIRFVSNNTVHARNRGL